MREIIAEFNSFFDGDAKLEIKGKDLEITIGSRTLQIQLPSVVGGRAEPID